MIGAVARKLEPPPGGKIFISPHGSSLWGRPGGSPADPVQRGWLLRPEMWLDGGIQLQVFGNARSAIWACLKNLRLDQHDEVCIETTSNGPYISSCVTKTVESVCSWSREITPATRLVLVIHEFGFPVPEPRLRELQRLGIPILEDCAYATGSRIEGANVGRYGDFAVYSLPKYFPVNRGGLLVARQPLIPSLSEGGLHAFNGYGPAGDELWDLLPGSSFDVLVQRDWNAVRRENWRRFAGELSDLGVEPYFSLDDAVVPGVFVCKLPAYIDGSALKKLFVDAGIEATEYYGHGGFYFPIHQFLSESEIAQLLGLFRSVE